mgnify:FL=1
MNRKIFLTQVVALFIITSSNANEHLTDKKEIIHYTMNDTMYLYSDKNSNGYYFYISPSGNFIMEYAPITMLQSSSGVYSGGKMFVTAIEKKEYENITDLFIQRIGIGNNSYRIKDGLRKGTAAITLLLKQNITYPFYDMTDIEKSIVDLATDYKKKYEK